MIHQLKRPVRSGSRKTSDFLRRLDPEFYQGESFVHWTMAIQNRQHGWLTAPFHFAWREVLLHCCARYSLLCPAYVLMPDHWHVLLIGTSVNADQRKAIKFFRIQANRLLARSGHALQRQAHDHVLRQAERKKGAFSGVAYYVFANSERASLVSDWRRYPYLGAMVPGFPNLDPRDDDYWPQFWKVADILGLRNGGE